MFCFQGNGLVTGGTYKWGEGAYIRGGLLPDVMFCLQGNGPVTGGTYKWGEGVLYPGGLLPDVLFCLQGNGPITGGGALFSWGGKGHKRKFTVFITRDTYNSTH